MLFLKMLRDMGRHKTQFISIFIMSFLGVFIYAGVGGEWKGLKSTSNNYYKKTNIADVWLYGNGFTDEDEKAVKDIDGIKETERRLVVDGVGKFDNKPKIALNYVEKNDISKMYLLSGESFSTDKDGIWLDGRFAKAHNLSVGDKITITYEGLTIDKKIMGTIYNPEYVYEPNGDGMTPDFSANGYAYISYRYFPVPNGIVYNQMMFKTDGRDASKLESKVDSTLKGKNSVYLLKKNHTSYAMFQQEIDQHKSMGSIFPVAFLVIALLTMLTTMTRIINSQRMQIGTLKALGFKKRTITLHYISYGFWISLAGSLLGAIIGPMTLPRLFYPSMSSYYTLPEWKPVIDPSFYAMAAATVALCMLITYSACRKVLADTPSKTLRPKAPKLVKHNVFERTALWKKLGFNMQWNLRDISRNKVRSLMGVLGVLGCTALLVCAFGMNDDMNDIKDWQYKQIDTFNSKLSVSDVAPDSEIKDAMSKVNGQAVMEDTVEIKKGSAKKTGSLTACDNVTLQKMTDKDRNIIDLKQDGVMISLKMADQLGVKTGDEIKWHIYGNQKWVTSTVTGIYRNPIAQGITLTRSSLEKLGYKFRTTSILTSENVTGKIAGISSIQDKSDLVKAWDKMIEAMMKMVYILIAAAASLAIVVLYNLGILSFTEAERELATLKVVGFKSNKLGRLLLVQNILLSAVGFIVGIPVGKWLIDAMVSTAGDSFDMMTRIHTENILLSFAITFAIVILVKVMFSGKIKNLDMVGSLKGVD